MGLEYSIVGVYNYLSSSRWCSQDDYLRVDHRLVCRLA